MSITQKIKIRLYHHERYPLADYHCLQDVRRNTSHVICQSLKTSYHTWALILAPAEFSSLSASLLADSTARCTGVRPEKKQLIIKSTPDTNIHILTIFHILYGTSQQNFFQTSRHFTVGDHFSPLKSFCRRRQHNSSNW